MTVLPFRSDREVGAAIPRALDHLDREGLLAHPTETVYGLGAGPTAGAVGALTALKDRGEPKPLLLLVEGMAMVARLGLRLTPTAEALAAAFWPGPLTLVLPGGVWAVEALRGPTGGIAVRWTSHPGMRALLAAREAPLTSTSANVGGGPTATTPSEIATLFTDAVQSDRLLILDGGSLPGSPSSTIVDCTTPHPRVVRDGAVSTAALASVLGSDAS